MDQRINEIELNGVTYVPKDSYNPMAPQLDGMEYCLVRTYSAGVFAGYVEHLDGKEAVLRNARRIWFWSGAASLSQLSVDGTSKPEACKFPTPVDRVLLTEVIEIIPMTEKAQKSIQEVPIWKE